MEEADFALVPDTTIPKGAWSIRIGFIMLGLTAARIINKIRMSGFTCVGPVGHLGSFCQVAARRILA